MLDLLWLVPALPLGSALLIALLGGILGERCIGLLASASVGAAALLAVFIGRELYVAYPPEGAFTQLLWTWMAVEGFTPSVSLYLDRLALVMTLVITGVGFLIHLYATGYMAGEEGCRRFFTVMNLFVGLMLVLVLAGDLLVLFLGWEGVGLCSYLLIGHWYQDPANGAAARKAFVVTRAGDAAMIAGLLVLFTGLGTTDIQGLMANAAALWPRESAVITVAALLLLAGAVGKSAQVPLQVWLPDAMAGPTPVSALIHAATMVTAGVYLVARTYDLFLLAPAAQATVAVIGTLTLILAALAALAQRDLKRMLAGSTVSQIGYMFLALGLGAVSAAIFHLVTHAFFKALLFLAAGAVILSLNGEHDMLRMGGLRRKLPQAFRAFLVGAASLAALPLVTAGFYSKSAILAAAWDDGNGGMWPWAAGAFAALLTAAYVFRGLFLVFLGPERTPPVREYGARMRLPMTVLMLLAVAGGLLNVPAFLEPDAAGAAHALVSVPELIVVALTLFGIWVASFSTLAEPPPVEQDGVARFARGGLGFDTLYGRLLVDPFRRLAAANRDDVLDLGARGLAALARLGHGMLRRSQTGELRWYAAATLLGAALVVGTLLFGQEGGTLP